MGLTFSALYQRLKSIRTRRYCAFTLGARGGFCDKWRTVKRFLLILLSLAFLATGARAAQFFTTAQEVTNVIAQAVTRAKQLGGGNPFIAVVDREGYVLGVWSVTGAGNSSLTDFLGPVPLAIAKAGTAAFLSSDQHAFSTRTAGFIVQQHFPPGVDNQPPGPLVGVNFSNLAFSDINRFKDLAGYNPALTNGTNGTSITTPLTGGLAGISGGLPLYKNGKLIGGVGVAFEGEDPRDITPASVNAPHRAEDVALAAQSGYAPAAGIFGSRVTVGGIRFAYVENSVPPPGAVLALTAGTNGNALPAFPLTNSVAIAFPPITIGGVLGELRAPIIADPAVTPLAGAVANRLTAAEVTGILTAAANRARTTRAGIRLPRGVPMQCFISVVSNPGIFGGTNGGAPVVLGTICTSPDTTRFSWDVSVQKARTALFFSGATRAFSSRTVGFMAQQFYPPGIINTAPGIFLGMQERFSIVTPPTAITTNNPLNGAVFSTSTSLNANLPNGITIFPGGFPLYRNGVLIGAIGVSGDGIDQDDIVAATGAALFPPPEGIRADKEFYRGARLPYAKFPRNPAL